MTFNEYQAKAMTFLNNKLSKEDVLINYSFAIAFFFCSSFIRNKNPNRITKATTQEIIAQGIIPSFCVKPATTYAIKLITAIVIA